MASPLLTTKFYIPPKRAEFISRPRLLECLNEGSLLDRKLTLISAPAGYGKSMLVSEWVNTIRSISEKSNQTACRIAWLSLDEGDNDLSRFLQYFIGAINEIKSLQGVIGKGASGMLQSPQMPSVEVVLTPLINDIAAISESIILVLDDYHLIETTSIDDAISFFLENMPPQMHLVIATREDPHLPLSRLRVRGHLTELRGADLRFTNSEAAEFLNHVMGLDLSVDDIAALETRTEGWIAGLQLAAISLQGRADTTSLIRSFTGSHRLVLDYLVEEVLNQQSESIQIFLLKTAVLNQLTGPLCDSLTGQENGQAVLERLEQNNLFIIPLDEERHWYRYHHLFTDLLRQRLQQQLPDQLPFLHSQASVWFEQNGFSEEAIEHALRAEDVERSARLIENVAEAVWGRGEYKLQRWLSSLPDELIFSKPQLYVFQAWVLLSCGNMVAADQLLQTALLALEKSTGSSDQMTQGKSQETGINPQTIRGRIATTQAFSAFYRGDMTGTMQYASAALEYLPEEDRSWRGTATHILGDVYDFSGEMVNAYQSRLEAVAVTRASGNIFPCLIANLKLAVTLRHQGQLQQVQEICQEQMQLTTENGMMQTDVFGWLLAICGEVLAETGDLEEAVLQTQRGVEITEGGGDLAMLGWSYLCLIRVLFSCGNLTKAEKIANRLEYAARESHVPPLFMNLKAAWQARIWLVQDQVERASQWAEERDLDAKGELFYLHEMEYIVLARILCAQGQLDEATQLLQRLYEAAETGGRTARMIEILALWALCLHAHNDTDQAIMTLEKALAFAEPGGFIQIFVDEGPAMARLLYKVLARGISPDYVQQLLAGFPVDEPKQADPSKSQATDYEWVEPLSEREIEVLQLIANGLTNQEIAGKLYLSLNTVKVHTRNIFGKLGANNRTQAAARARALGILSTD